MKFLSFLSIITFFTIIGYATEKEIVLPSETKEVVVFQTGAQVYKTGSVVVNEGVTNIIMTGLPRNINQQSIQVKGYGDFTILSVNYQLNYLKTQKESEEIANLKKKLESLKYEKSDTENKIEIYKAEETILLANKSIGGDQTGVSVTALKEAMNYFHTKLNEIKSKELEKRSSLVKLEEEIRKVENQLNSLQAKQNVPTSEVLVKVLAKSQVKATLDLKYVIYNAGWTPEYDLRAVDITRPVQMSYKAKVYQSSGEDWNDVKLTISTGNPRISGAKPVLNPWYLDFYYPNQIYMYESRVPLAKKEMYDESVVEVNDMELSEVEEISFETTTNQTNVEFNIDIPYTIPSDGKSYTVQINEFSLDADYTYYTAPKLVESAFLLAQITGWEKYNLLPGAANIFFEGTYVGNSVLDPKNTNDTLDLSLGRDESIVVTRTKIKDFESKRVIGLNKKETFGYEIKIRNTKNSNIKILIDDQFPISSNKDIEIEQIEKSGARLNEITGKLSWEMELQASETKKVDLKYSIKYPKDKQIDL